MSVCVCGGRGEGCVCVWRTLAGKVKEKLTCPAKTIGYDNAHLQVNLPQKSTLTTAVRSRCLLTHRLLCWYMAFTDCLGRALLPSVTDTVHLSGLLHVLLYNTTACTCKTTHVIHTTHYI